MIRVFLAGMVLLQDAGRAGLESIGVAASGPFDSVRYDALVSLLRSDRTLPSFEILAGRLQLGVDLATVMAVVGHASVAVNSVQVGANQVFAVSPSDMVTVDRDRAAYGPVYVAVRGMRAGQVLGSSSTNTMTDLGLPSVSAGVTFPVLPEALDASLIGRFRVPGPTVMPNCLRFIAGPHPGPARFSVHVSAVSRSGVRLTPIEGPTPAGVSSMASFPVLPGAIQLPPSGGPIILGPDAGVTGGYPVIGVVINADIHLISRLRPGEPLRFQSVTAEEAAHAQISLLNKQRARIFDIQDVCR
jgi:allophanate hydrolase subunit 2